jgi:hypothetical protein
MSALSIMLTLPLSVVVSHICAASFLAVMFGAPAMLIWAQRYKK